MVELTGEGDELDQHLAGPQKANEAEDEYTDVETLEYSTEIRSASALTKQTIILLEFLGDKDFCKNITSRERGIIDKHLDRLYKLSTQLDTAVEELDEVE